MGHNIQLIQYIIQIPQLFLQNLIIFIPHFPHLIFSFFIILTCLSIIITIEINIIRTRLFLRTIFMQIFQFNRFVISLPEILCGLTSSFNCFLESFNNFTECLDGMSLIFFVFVLYRIFLIV